MRKFIKATLLNTFLLTVLIGTVFPQAINSNIQEVYQKKDSRSWGDIFYSFFDRTGFGKSYALVIGIGDYKKDDWNKLESPFYDACRVRDFLINDAGFDLVITLTNARATKRQINKLMEETFPSRLTENDRFLFYFSGHGTSRIIRNIPFGYLVLQNCSSQSYGDMITMDDIERWDRILRPTRHVLFILDCCFSGLAGKQTYSSLTDKTVDRLSQYAHYLITAGTSKEESVASLKDWEGSLFTDSFLKAASGRADQSSFDYKTDGIVSLKELMKYIGKRIDDESLKKKGSNPLSKGIKCLRKCHNFRTATESFFS